ncbi:DEAD/DEAH box helicase, partial [Alicyclobacillus macrosporangiidus]|uniref:DEAD/DEAH box helicase n=1 Tax=Alicyclobacillus macrosporangiidus TaxID=392015 RepID=UPI0026EC25CC
MSQVMSIRLVFRWLPGRGVLIHDPDEPFADADLLKRRAHLVLAHHPDTFYGTDVALMTDTDEDLSGILLTPLQAVTFFAQLEPNRMVHWDWPDDLPVWREAAQRMADAFASNRLAPALDGARPGRPAWRLILEDGTDALAGLPDWVREWANLAVWELVEADADLDRAWQGVLDAHPVLAEDPGRGLWLDEAQWHEAIGWRPDPCPFTAALRLCEPAMGLERGASWDDAADGPTGWRLQVVLRDKVQPDLVYGLWPDVAREGRLAPRTGPEGRTAEGTPETGVDPDLPPAPRDWLAYEERLRQSVGHWLAAVPWLADAGGWLPRGSLSEADAWCFLTEAIPPLRAAGCPVMVPAWWERAMQQRPRLRARVRPASGVHGMFGIDQTVQFDWRVALGGEEMDPEAFERLVAQKRRLIWFHGQWRVVDPAWAQRLLTTMKRRGEALTLADVLERALLGGDAGAGADGEPAGADRADGATEDGSEPGGDGAIATDPGATGTAEAPFEVALNEPLRALIGGLRDIRQMPVLPTPPGFRGELRAYQRIGFSWFVFLRRFGLGACLADDMGLGKTVQFIAYLLHVRSEGAALGPALIVCPTSVVGNWQKELERFAPGLRVYVHYGSGRAKAEAFADAYREADVVVTSYTLAYLDGDLLQGVVWDTVCLDEAQNIKNPHTKQAQAVRHLQARHRVAMTGTPVENRLTELWSLFAFLNPGYLGSERAFQSRFAAPIEKSGDAARTRVLQHLVRPFLLRRMKTDPGVAADLPEKAEAKVYVPLTKEQAALYEGVLQDMLARLADVDGMERRGLVLATL